MFFTFFLSFFTYMFFKYFDRISHFFNKNANNKVLLILIFSFILIFAMLLIAKALDEQRNVESNSLQINHPGINIIIGILLIIIMAGFLHFSVNWVYQFILRLTKIVSKIDVVIIVALITGIISIISLVVSKYIEYKKSRQEYLTKKEKNLTRILLK